MSKPNRSKLWFLVHSWLALPVWFFLLIICVTGTLATVSQEIVWLANPEIRASQPDADAPRLSYSVVMERLKQQVPDIFVQSLHRPDEDHFALNARVSYPDGRTLTVYVNPYTGVIQGESPTFNFSQFTRALHGWWLMPFTNGYSWGWYLVSFMAIPMLASLITGLVVYKRFWRGFLRPRLRFNRGARVFWGDFHRLSGIWSIWFIAVISITGIWFLIQAVLGDNQVTISTEGIPTFIAREDIPLTDGSAAKQISLDQAIVVAKQSLPNLNPSFISLPGNAYSPILIYGRGWYPLMGESALINPYNGAVEKTRSLSDRSALEFVTESMRPLHTGDFGGLWVKLIWFFFGLILSFMMLSGMLIWTKRTVQASLALTQKHAKKAHITPVLSAVKGASHE